MVAELKIRDGQVGGVFSYYTFLLRLLFRKPFAHPDTHFLTHKSSLVEWSGISRRSLAALVRS